MQVFELSLGGIAMLAGPGNRIEYANEQYYSMIGASRDIIGKTVAEAISEVVRQGFICIVDGVYRSGEAFVARALPIELTSGQRREMFDNTGVNAASKAKKSTGG